MFKRSTLISIYDGWRYKERNVALQAAERISSLLSSNKNGEKSFSKKMEKRDAERMSSKFSAASAVINSSRVLEKKSKCPVHLRTSWPTKFIIRSSAVAR